MKRALVALLLLVSSAARAEPVTLRLASVLPEGTAWARELRAFGREVAASTQHEVQIRWYLSGIAGDELQSHERVQRDQLDGIISGGMLCQRLAPSMRAAGTVSEFRDRDEARYVMARLRPLIDGELSKAGYVNVATAGMGFSVIFSRTPVQSMAELRKLRPWLWSLDEVLRAQLTAMGMKPVPLPVEGSARAYDEGKVDGFIGLPAGALAFQWSAQARYVIDLRVGYLTGCMLLSHRAWDALPHEAQQQIESAAAKLQVRVEDVALKNDEMLLSGLFARQGLRALPVPPSLQAEFSEAAHAAQKQVEKLMPPGMLDRVAGWIAEYRASQRPERR